MQLSCHWCGEIHILIWLKIILIHYMYSVIKDLLISKVQKTANEMPTRELGSSPSPCRVSKVLFLPTVLCWIDDGYEAVWSISFIVEGLDFDLKCSERPHGLIFMDISSNIWISNSNFFPFFPIKWLKCHYVTEIVAIVVFSWQRLNRIWNIK